MKNLNIFIYVVIATMSISCSKNQSNELKEEQDTSVIENTEQVASKDNTVLENVNDETAPVIVFETETFDFGEVKAGSTTEKEFIFTNKGETPLLIKNATASCGCTVPEYSNEAIAPGEEGKLKLSFSAPQSNGKQSKTVTLTTNTAKGVEKYIVSANVVGAKIHQPTPPKPVGNLPKPNLE